MIESVRETMIVKVAIAAVASAENVVIQTVTVLKVKNVISSGV
jgi:hypothetical protein